MKQYFPDRDVKIRNEIQGEIEFSLTAIRVGVKFNDAIIDKIIEYEHYTSLYFSEGREGIYTPIIELDLELEHHILSTALKNEKVQDSISDMEDDILYILDIKWARFYYLIRKREDKLEFFEFLGRGLHG